jgi:hypothetical protein
MKKALIEGFWLGFISVLVLVALMVWTILISEMIDSVMIKGSIVIALMFAIPMTLSVLEYKQKRLLDEALSNQLKKDTKA